MITLNRRDWLAGAMGVSVAFAGRSALAQDADRNKLVVIIARGAMDGLSVTVPSGDPNYEALRGGLVVRGALPLDADFGLHPAMPRLHALHEAGEARFAPAVAIPARLRSHFDAQDILENGGAALRQERDGWLNRALAITGTRGLAVGAQTPLILRGDVQTASWAPGGAPDDDGRLAALLMDLYADDPLLGPALTTGLQTEAMAQTALDGQRLGPRNVATLGRGVAGLMAGPEGADIVALTLDGYDTHARQGADEGQLANRLSIQDQVIDGLRLGLGEQWGRTAVVVATEFGRTVRANGTAGTDHGTASCLILAGGAVRPGGLLGDWPTLADNRLYEGRDLTPTLDVRSVFKGLLRDHLGLDQTDIERTVFPNSGEATAVSGLV